MGADLNPSAPKATPRLRQAQPYEATEVVRNALADAVALGQQLGLALVVLGLALARRLGRSETPRSVIELPRPRACDLIWAPDRRGADFAQRVDWARPTQRLAWRYCRRSSGRRRRRPARRSRPGRRRRGSRERILRMGSLLILRRERRSADACAPAVERGCLETMSTDAKPAPPDRHALREGLRGGWRERLLPGLPPNPAGDRRLGPTER
jgi:hypothetical protein